FRPCQGGGNLPAAHHLQDRAPAGTGEARKILAGGPPVIRLLITSGRGPAECRIAAANALAALAPAAEAARPDPQGTKGRDLDGHGPSSAIAVVSGPGEERFAESWTGSVQWIAQSPLRPLHKRKNWFIGIMELPLPSAPLKPLDFKEVRFEAFRAGGP